MKTGGNISFLLQSDSRTVAQRAVSRSKEPNFRWQDAAKLPERINHPPERPGVSKHALQDRSACCDRRY